MKAAAAGLRKGIMMSFVRYVLALLSLSSWGSAAAENPPASNLDEGCHMDPLGGCRG
jgi:hypothetical protein